MALAQCKIHSYPLFFGFLFILPYMLNCNDDPTLRSVMAAVEKLVQFYGESYQEMNLDGIYGLRVLEGQLLALIMDFEKERIPRMSKYMTDWVQLLQRQASIISSQAIPYLRKEDEEYYLSLKPLVHEPWMMFKKHRRIDKTLRWAKTDSDPEHIDEQFSDKCMGQLMGSTRIDGLKCIITDDCLAFMTKPGQQSYAITHQLLYIILAEKTGCLGHVENWLRKQKREGVDHLVLEFCTNNLFEMHELILLQDAVIIPRHQDLFLEQEFVCASQGYIEFLHKDLLKQILTWQKPNGCFGKMQKADLRQEAERHGYTGDEDYDYEESTVVEPDRYKTPNRLKEGYQQRNQSTSSSVPLMSSNQVLQDPSLSGHKTAGVKPPGVFKAADGDSRLDKVADTDAWVSRKLLVEKDLPGGCLAHKTAVAAGALSQYLRFLIDPGPPDMADLMINRTFILLVSQTDQEENRVHVQRDEKRITNLFKRRTDNVKEPYPRAKGRLYDEQKGGADNKEQGKGQLDTEYHEKENKGYNNYDEADNKNEKKIQTYEDTADDMDTSYDNNADIVHSDRKKQENKKEYEGQDNVGQNDFYSPQEERLGSENPEKYDKNLVDSLKMPKFPVMKGRFGKNNLHGEDFEKEESYLYYETEKNGDKVKIQRKPRFKAGLQSLTQPDTAETVEHPEERTSNVPSMFIIISVFFFLVLIVFRLARQRRIAIRYSLFSSRS